jgi:hypothetical protein
MDGNAPKHWWWSWAAGSGAIIIDGVPADLFMQTQIPAANTVVNPGQPTDAVPSGFLTPSQGLFVDRNLEGYLGVFVDIREPNQQRERLFNGTASLGGPSSAEPGLKATGDLINKLQADQAGQRAIAAVSTPALGRTTMVRPGQVIELFMDISGNLDGPDRTEPPMHEIEPGAIYGGAESLVAQLRLVGAPDSYRMRALMPGDAQGNGRVDADDLFAASPNFNRGEIDPGWIGGDWDQNMKVDADDLFAASPFFDVFATPSAEEIAPRVLADGVPDVLYNPTTGEFTLHPDGVVGIDSFKIDSASGIFTEDPPVFPGASVFTTDTDIRISRNFFAPALSGAHNLGAVAPTGLTEAFLMGDLTMLMGISGMPNIVPQLTVVAEPTTCALALAATALAILAARRRG